ncbi:MAG TPA: LemA family protein [Thermoleophilaceae bacterium]
MDTAVYVLLALAALVVVWAIVTLNSFVRARNQVDESWSGVDVQLKRRHDLVPNLVETVKGYAAHESGVLEEVTRARAAAVAATDSEQQGRAEASLTSALGNIRAVAEQYPQLRAAENFQQLQAELAQIEDQIQAARRIYNANVRAFNTRIQIFPNSLLAGAYQPRHFFELDDPAERAVPAVAF